MFFSGTHLGFSGKLHRYFRSLSHETAIGSWSWFIPLLSYLLPPILYAEAGDGLNTSNEVARRTWTSKNEVGPCVESVFVHRLGERVSANCFRDMGSIPFALDCIVGCASTAPKLLLLPCIPQHLFFFWQRGFGRWAFPLQSASLLSAYIYLSHGGDTFKFLRLFSRSASWVPRVSREKKEESFQNCVNFMRYALTQTFALTQSQANKKKRDVKTRLKA